MKYKTERRWVITGRCGLYVGATLTRKAAISEHCRAYFPAGMSPTEADIKLEWKHCRKLGDRCVSVNIKYPALP